ncbi:MAG TPA: 50S ribosomal protein L29 [Candidatus Paceibacterota bacterium]|jgi:large subunit ribosomal protein L29|nr:50S ribosomal protein L29 [Candidatus Paceibacterota bacterium]HRS47667.1 50S ribosomal protein L29 [Candidatus Paceibacterota bacterium]
MKRKELNSFKNLSEKELFSKLTELQSKLETLKFDKKLAKLQNTAQIQQIRRDIARVLTILKEKKYDSNKN